MRNTSKSKTSETTSEPEVVKPKSGIVALLDGLGTRTANLEQAVAYVGALDALQRDVKVTLEVYLEDHPKDTLDFYKDIHVHFFGDSVLLIYETAKDQPLYQYIEYLFAILTFFYVAAFKSGI